MTQTEIKLKLNGSEPVKMSGIQFTNLMKRHGYSIVNTQYGMIAKKRNAWVYADPCWTNSDKVTNFQAFYKDFYGKIKERNMTYVWELRNFIRIHGVE